MPHNSIALVEDSSPCKPHFFACRSPDGSVDPRGFFAPPDDSLFYWLVAGTVLPRSRALLAIAQVQGHHGLDDFHGSDVIVVRDFGDPNPERWEYTTSRIAVTSRFVSFNEGVYAAGDGFVYLIGMAEHGEWGAGRTQHLARISEEALLRFDWAQMQHWAGHDSQRWVEQLWMRQPWVGAPGWSYHFDASAVLYTGPYTEGTLVEHPAGFFYVVGCQAFQSEVIVYTAPKLTGPWSATHAYTIPPLADGQVAYAAKAHPEFARGDEIVFTYNINGDHANMSIYHPRFIRLTITADANAAAVKDEL